MGVQQIDGAASGEALRAFTTQLLRDLRAFEVMVRDGMIESGVHRIGAEQEVFLVDGAWRAAPAIAAVLAGLREPCFVPEIGTFQAEINLDPFLLRGEGLAALHAQLDARLATLRAAARAAGVEPVLTGILPTLRRTDPTLRNVTARARYAALNDATLRLRGSGHRISIAGTDELQLLDDSVMLGAATASFQVHLQVAPHEFARLYNAAQAVAGAQLAVGANSPLLFGQRLWHETRVPLFQQASDTRAPSMSPTRRPARTIFGTRWVRESPVEVCREDVTRFPVVLSSADAEDALDELACGRVPTLAALRVHTSTVYRWNRVCYGTAGGVAHLRIENRVLPSGPTTLDEVANAALWLGLVFGVAQEYGDVARRMAFDDAKANFFEGARAGMGAHLRWVDGTSAPARELLRERLLPLARAGLRAQGVAPEHIERYLGVIAARVDTGRTGAAWLLASDAAVRTSGTRGEQLAALTAAASVRERQGRAVHEWPPARLEEAGGPQVAWSDVEQVMVTDVPTVRDEDAVSLASAVVEWHAAEYLPVEDARGVLVGIVSAASLAAHAGVDPSAPVRAVMERDPLCVTPETRTIEALAALHARGASCVVVVRDGRLLGLVSAASLAAGATRAPRADEGARDPDASGPRRSVSPPYARCIVLTGAPDNDDDDDDGDGDDDEKEVA